MNFVVCDYSNAFSTEPFYLNACINLLPNCKSTFWNMASYSLYDILDYTKADVFVCKATHIPKDIAEYSRENGKPEVILNVTGLQVDNIKRIVSYLNDAQISCPFIFTNIPLKINEISGKNLVYIPYGADVFLNNNDSIKFSVDTCYITDREVPINDTDKTYHIISNDKNIENKVDSALPIINMAQIYKNYNNIVIKYFDGFLPQIFFDAVYYGNNACYELDDQDKQREVEELIKKILKIEDTNFSQIKNIVQTKHTCLNRTKTFLSQLPCQDLIKEIDNFIETYRQRINS